MASRNPAAARAAVLERLKAAGPAGLAKGKLLERLGSRGEEALKALLAAGGVANLGTRSRPRFVLPEHFRPLERACEHIEKKALGPKAAAEGALALFTREELTRGLTGEPKKKIPEAFARLFSEARLLRCKRGRNLYLIHREHLRHLVAREGRTEPHRAPAPYPPVVCEREAVLSAYRRLREKSGFSHVEIAALAREAGCPLAPLKEFILSESRAGRAVLGLGDWSLSTEETRAGAVELLGRPHLLVSFETG